jgi:hypothetical protein
MAWTQTSWRRWDRHDGAAVKWDDSSPYPNSMNPRALMWTAFEPDPSEMYLKRTSKRGFSYPRRWKTAQAAMAEVDRLFPETK